MQEIKGYLFFFTAILVLSIAYYFVIALPKGQRDRLDFERQRYEQQQQEKKDKEQEESTAKSEKGFNLQTCIDLAEEDRISTLSLNGTVGKDNIIRGIPAHISERADKRKKDDVDACLTQFK